MKLCYVGDEGRVGLFSEECQQIICEVSIVEESGSTVCCLFLLYFSFFFQFQQRLNYYVIVQGGHAQIM